jgi:hypothetical protein
MDRRQGAPWLVASGLMALRAVATWFAQWIPRLNQAVGAYATLPESLTLIAGLTAGAATAWFGWEAGKPPARQNLAPA